MAQIVDEETQRGHAEREKIISSGLQRSKLNVTEQKKNLRQQVAALAVAGAEKILERAIDAAAHSDMLKTCR